MRESWLGAKMTTMTWMTSNSKDSAESARRQKCVKSAYKKQTGKGVKVNDIDVKVKAGKVEGSTTLIGPSWGSDNSFANDTASCDNRRYSSNYFVQNRFKRTEIVSVGALPVSKRDDWLKSTKDAPSVVRMVLAPISELFEPSYVNDIPLDPNDLSKGNLDADLLKRSFANIMENYCQMMLGEDCPPAGGCALYGLCGDDAVCRDDEQASKGFRCVPKRGCSGIYNNCRNYQHCIDDQRAPNGFRCVAGCDDCRRPYLCINNPEPECVHPCESGHSLTICDW